MESSIIQKYEGKDIKYLLGRAEKYFNLFIRLRDTDDNGYGRCISSGNLLRIPSSNAHAGHYFSAGKYPRLKFDERNVHLQGKSDNYFNHGNESSYRIKLVEKIGAEEVESMEFVSKNRSIYKWNRYYLIEVIETYKKKAKELSKRKMFKVTI